VVYNEDGAAVPGARVDLIPQAYNPVVDTPLSGCFSDTTDGEGRYRLDSIAAGGYTLIAQRDSLEKNMYITSLQIGDSPTDTVEGGTLHPSGDVAIELSDTISDSTDSYVFIIGTTFYARAGRHVVLRGIPAGHIPPVCIISKSGGTARTVAANGVDVMPHGTTLVSGGAFWPHSARLRLNTSASGADIKSSQTGFPVLVRLSADNFSFGQARGRGEDLRFTNEQGILMPHEVEWWDSANAAAALWVYVDTLRGNDSTQSIMMYWGTDDAHDARSGAPEVFDTANGFEGVWHLGEAIGAVRDATRNGFAGSRNGSASRVPGQIGYAQVFRTDGDFFDLGNVCNPDTSGFTVSAWVKPSGTSGYRAILSKSAGDAPTANYGWLFEVGKDGALAAFTASAAGSWGDEGTFVSASNIFLADTTTWHHVAVVINRSGNNQCRLYIDGVEVPSRPGGNIAAVGPVVNSLPLRIGADAKGGCPWKGGIDECSFSRGVRSAEWIKLCYMNQRTDDKLIIFKSK
jgi:hypothetical protein